jgi:hypothetical protein
MVRRPEVQGGASRRRWVPDEGDYFLPGSRQVSLPNAGTAALVSALQRDAHRPPSQFPTLNRNESGVGTDFMIKGIAAAGENATQEGTIKAMRSVTSYDGAGLLPNPIDFKTIFGHDLPKTCDWVMVAKPKGFVALSPTPTGRHDVPGTSLAQS